MCEICLRKLFHVQLNTGQNAFAYVLLEHKSSPSFRHVLVDLGRVADERLSAQPRLRAHLKALKYARRQTSPRR